MTPSAATNAALAQTCVVGARIDQARIDKWIRDRLMAAWPGGCWHCPPTKSLPRGQKFVDVRGRADVVVQFHRQCESEWRRAQEAAARKALGLSDAKQPSGART